MRILHVIYDDTENPWVGGGGAAGTRNIAEFAAKHGHAMEMVTGAYPHARDRFEDERLKTTFLGLGSLGYLVSRVTFSFGAFFFLLKNSSKYDVVIDDISPFSPTLSFLFKTRVPVAGNFQNIFQRHFYKKFPLIAPFLWLLEYVNLHAYDYYIVSSPFEKEHVGKGKEVKIVPNGMFFDQFPDLSKENKQSYIAIYGRVEIYQKGLDVLCDMVKNIRGFLTGEDIVFRVAGSGKDEVAFREMVRTRGLMDLIQFEGRIAGDDRFRFLARALFLFAPSRFEAMPRAAIESLVSGTPVVCPRTPPYEFIMQAPDIGIMVENPSVATYADTVQNLLSDKKRMQAMSRAARAYSKRFDEEEFLAQRLDFYAKMASQGPKR